MVYSSFCFRTLVGCGFFGLIPDSIGSLKQLAYLSLNSHSFNGNIPPSIGNMAKLYWLDLSDNQLTGSIPVSNANMCGLDILVRMKHLNVAKVFQLRMVICSIPNLQLPDNTEGLWSRLKRAS
ncbi:hypothetical protein Dimus_031472 [Dionaea muscipula]